MGQNGAINSKGTDKMSYCYETATSIASQISEATFQNNTFFTEIEVSTSTTTLQTRPISRTETGRL